MPSTPNSADTRSPAPYHLKPYYHRESPFSRMMRPLEDAFRSPDSYLRLGGHTVSLANNELFGMIILNSWGLPNAAHMETQDDGKKSSVYTKKF